MAPRSTHTVHIFSLIPGLADAISRSLPEVTVVNLRTHDLGLQDYFENVMKELTEEEIAPLSKAEILFIDSPSLSQVLLRKGVSFLENLLWVQVPSAGVDKVTSVLAPGIDPPFILTRCTSDATALMMAEHVVGQIVCHERGWLDTHLKQGSKECSQWQALRDYRSLSQMTVGVMGLGKIGLATAKALKAFGCRVHGLARTSDSRVSTEPYVDQLWLGQEGVSAFLKDCDYLVNLLPSTPLTRGLLGGAVLSMAIKRPVLVNVGRGDIISEADLLKGLEQGWLSAALLDCFEKEPVPEDSLLWTHPRVVMTPHNSSVGSEEYKRLSVIRDFRVNFANFLDGRPLDGRVDWQSGY